MIIKAEKELKRKGVKLVSDTWDFVCWGGVKIKFFLNKDNPKNGMCMIQLMLDDFRDEVFDEIFFPSAVVGNQAMKKVEEILRGLTRKGALTSELVVEILKNASNEAWE